MDALAQGLRNAAALIQGGELDAARAARYSSYQDTRLGRQGRAAVLYFFLFALPAAGLKALTLSRVYALA